MLSRNEKVIHRILNLIGIIFALYGTWLTIFRSGEIGDNDLLYFTIQSNIWIALIHSYFFIAELVEERSDSFRISNGMRTLKYILTGSVTLTFIVFFAVLVPEIGLFVAKLPGSVETHLIAPLAAILDYIFFERKHVATRRTVSLVMVPPWIYFAVILILSFTTNITYINDQPMPYFFLNYHQLGWFRIADGRIGVFYWVIILSILMLAIGFTLHLLNRSVRKHISRRRDTVYP